MVMVVSVVPALLLHAALAVPVTTRVALATGLERHGDPAHLQVGLVRVDDASRGGEREGQENE